MTQKNYTEEVLREKYGAAPVAPSDRRAAVRKVRGETLSGEVGVGLPPFTPHEESVAAFWEDSYVRFERMWGREPSQTATALIGLFNQDKDRLAGRIDVAELGCGYGRDAFAFAKEGFDVLAVDLARHGLVLANQDYRNMSRLDLPGSIRFLHGTVRAVLAAVIGKLDGVSCHRTLHLMKKDGVLDFARCAAAVLRPGAFISIGARSSSDFDAETMEWVQGQEGQTGRYKDPSRNGQLLTFLDEPFLRLALEPYFTVRFSEGIEQERSGKNATTKLIYMTGTKRPETYTFLEDSARLSTKTFSTPRGMEVREEQ
jgi:SAM-dependent methyltransferase